MGAVLCNCLVVDGKGRPPLENAAVRVTDGVISDIGPSAAMVDAAGDDQVIDLGGMTLLPGLWDLHVHLGWKWPVMSKRVELYDGGEVALRAYRRALDFLCNGVTGLRSVADEQAADINVRNCINEGTLPGPRLFAAGQGVTSTGGHGHNTMACVEADGADEFRRLVRQQLRRGADLIKILATGGIGGPHEGLSAPQLFADEIESSVAVAHNAGKHVAIHAGGAEGIKLAVSSGVDTVEHGYSFDDAAAEMMAEQGVMLVPTLCVSDSVEYWQELGTPEWALNKIRRAGTCHKESAVRAIRAGVKIGVGTDLPTVHMDGTVATVREMELLVGLGMTPLEVITAATRSGAELCGVGEQSGTIEQGKLADLIAVAGNPVRNISALRNVKMVMVGGRVVVRQDGDGLNQLLA